jgi:Family of unknown function (DUF5367)
MKPYDKLLFVLLGCAFWAAGTILYHYRGHHVFEASDQGYWINFVLTPMVTTVICILILKWRDIPRADWGSAALLLALPGMFGEAALLSHFAVCMPRLRPETAGRYGAFLFATYALFLTIAEIVTMRAGL